ncbi:Fic family protein [methane-oxidizing endosymbiont of Gigantopelta aegis]|uniref:Fic family protein n=1 Tax=methane-oxidizing endosymbiont of Gigantopelta aegis TaxID=2794938 RepID=UPI003CC9270C
MALIKAHRPLAELKGVVKSIPNQQILLSTLTLQEAKDSSEIENINTSQDELYKHTLRSDLSNLATKEVANYNRALQVGYQAVKEHGLLTLNTILKIQENLENNRAGFRKQLGTVLKNEQTGKIIYTPPEPQQVPELMADLEQIINQQPPQKDPLVKKN